MGILTLGTLKNHYSQILRFIGSLTTGGTPKSSPPPSQHALSVPGLHRLWGATVMFRLTYSSIEGGVQVRDKHLWVDIVQVPGEIVAA